jgi:HD superfamily phosphohydrolase
MLFDYLLEDNYIDISDDDTKLIHRLIEGEEDNTNWIFQIVANKKNSIDVDKFDYIFRDSYHAGIKSITVDYDRIFNNATLINGNLCFKMKVN